MGCCLSHENNNRAPHKHTLQQDEDEEFPCVVSKSPPRPEEESVKEVLSETPNPKPIPESHFRGSPKHDQQLPTKKNSILLTRAAPAPAPAPALNHPGSPDPTPPAPACSTPEEISDTVSLSLSLSESISNNTLRDREEDEVYQWSGKGQMGHRSQGQNGNYNNNNNNNFNNRARAAGGSPLKRAVEPGQRRNPSPVQRRDVGENSGRRSRSPGNRANVGRSPSGRRNGPSPGRVRMGPNKVEERERERERESEWEGPNESLENPLVSLECFIFL